jgi:ABC-2 type transport system permease protein
MRNIWLVIKHEIRTTLRQKSFWFFTLLMPAFFLAFQMYHVIRYSEPGTSAADKDITDGKAASEAAATSPQGQVIGLVDESGLIAAIPDGVPAEMFAFFPDNVAARTALDAGDVEQYVHVAPDYIATGKVTVYAKNFQIREGGENMGVAFGSSNQWMLRYILDVNLTGDDELVKILGNPIPEVLAEQHVVDASPEIDEDDRALAELVANVMPYVYYFILVVVSGYLMRSVVAEKENRTVELLLLSLRPRELMVGKTLGLSVVAWIQLLVWLGVGVLMLDQSSNWLNVSGFKFSPDFFVWAILFLVFGYLLYASVMAAAGAIAPTAREGGKVTWLLILPLMPTMMFGSEFLNEPHGTLSLVLSLFPFSAPSAMVTRLAVADVPLWQPIVSLLGLGVTAYLMALLAARFFRAGNLLSQASFNWRRFATGWRE